MATDVHGSLACCPSSSTWSLAVPKGVLPPDIAPVESAALDSTDAALVSWPGGACASTHESTPLVTTPRAYAGLSPPHAPAVELPVSSMACAVLCGSLAVRAVGRVRRRGSDTS